jgi:hypothetical protein
MKLKSLALTAAVACCHRRCGRLLALRPPSRRPRSSSSRCWSGRTGPVRAQRHALGQRPQRLPEAGQCPRRHQRREDPGRGVRNRLRHRQGRGVLRAPEGQERRRHGVPAAVHRHHLRADRQGPGDKIPLITAGYGRSDTADGNIFKWNFPLLGTTGWPTTGAAAHRQEGRRLGQAQGQEDRAGLPRQPFGKEPIPLLQERSKMHGFDLQLLPVPAPGVEQKATWLQVRQQRPTTSSCGAGA